MKHLKLFEIFTKSNPVNFNVKGQLSESLLDSVPEPGAFKDEILKNIKEVLIKELKKSIIGIGAPIDQDYHSKISPSYYNGILLTSPLSILDDYCKEKRIKKQDVIDFINWEIGVRRNDKNTPFLKKDQDFINVINKVVDEYQKRR